MEKVILTWTGADTFNPKNGVGCSDMNPKELMLYSLAECSGKTAIYILNRMRVFAASLEIEVSGDLSGDERAPESVFTSFYQIFRVECNSHEDHNKILHAVKLTHEKYCGVTLMMEKIAPVGMELYVDGENISDRMENDAELAEEYLTISAMM